MGELKNLFGEFPEPPPVIRETSHREVVDAEYARASALWNTVTPEVTHVRVDVDKLGFLIMQLGCAREALRGIEQSLTQAVQLQREHDPSGTSPLEVWAQASLEYVAQALAFDETTFAMTSETMPPEIAHELVDIPLCPGCGAPDLGLTDGASAVVRTMGAKHAFTRIEIVRCVEKAKKP